MNIPVALRRAILSAGPLFLLTSPASAHHVMGGKLPSTFVEGLLSGLGHPVIGPEHIAVLLALGLVVGASRLSLMLPVAFIAAMAAGVEAHVSGIAVPGVEAGDHAIDPIDLHVRPASGGVLLSLKGRGDRPASTRRTA